MKIGQVAAATGITPDAIRLYEARGLLGSERGANGYRLFAPAVVDLIKTIRLAQRLGFRLGEVAEVMGTLRDDGLSPEFIRTVLSAKLADVDARIADLNALRSLLQTRLQDVCGLGM